MCNQIVVGDKVEIKETGARLFVKDIVGDECHLSISPDDGYVVVCVQLLNDLIKIGTTRYVWVDVQDGTFSDSWELDHLITQDYMAELVIDMAKYYKHGKLIEFRCINDHDFEFTHLMKLR